MIRRCQMCTGLFDTRTRGSNTRTCSEECGRKLHYQTRRRIIERWMQRHPGRHRQLSDASRARNPERYRQLARERATRERRARGIEPRSRKPREARLKLKDCVICGQEFTHRQRSGRAKTCSPACAEALYQTVLAKGRAERASRRTGICHYCGLAFRPPHRLNKYCSAQCKKDVARDNPARREKQRLRSWRQLRRRGVPIRPPVMTPEERKQRIKEQRVKYARAKGVKPQKRLTAEERAQYNRRRVEAHKAQQKRKYAADPAFRAKRSAESREYRQRMINADPAWRAKDRAKHRERELNQIANPKGERQWLLRSRAELNRVKRLLSGGHHPPKASPSPRGESPLHSNSPV